ncbi:MAG: Fur family transcriptional regulator [Bacteroidales bacterium]|nr:Fur family transcriptional regulator [Bacteroidales bacterium]
MKRTRKQSKTDSCREWRDMFHAAGMRMTKTRLAIYRALNTRDDHPTVQSLHEAIGKQYPRVSKFTVYRAMNAMEAAGLVRRIAVWKGCVRYDGELTAHAHFLCETCGRVMDVAGHDLARIAETLFELPGAVTKADLLLFGQGDECAARKAECS